MSWKDKLKNKYDDEQKYINILEEARPKTNRAEDKGLYDWYIGYLKDADKKSNIDLLSRNEIDKILALAWQSWHDSMDAWSAEY